MRLFTSAVEPFEVYPELDEFEAIDPEWQSKYSSPESDYIRQTYVNPFGLQHQLESGFPGIEPELEDGFSFSGFPNSILDALRKGLESVAVKLAVTFGYRDEVTLTNIVFFARHPERSGRKLVKGEPGFVNLSREWLGIRDRLVRPTLRSANRDVKSAPPSKGGAASTKIETRLPDSGLGYYSYKTVNGFNGKFGLPETIQALRAIGEVWQRKHPQGPRIGIGDISLKGGGDIPHHRSHERGVDIDIDLIRNDKREGRTNYRDKTYSRALTQDLVNLIRANGVLTVEKIFFNDPAVTGVSDYPGHDNHLHVRFCAPGDTRCRPRQQRELNWVGEYFAEGEFAEDDPTDYDNYKQETGQPSAQSAPKLLGGEKASHGETIYLQIGLGLGKKLSSTGIYVPKSFKLDSGLTVVLYLHGHKGMCPGNSATIKEYWDGVKFPFFALREEVSASGQNVIFVAPSLGAHSEAPGLIKRGGFDAFMQKVLAGFNEHYLMPRHHRRIDEVRSIILAAHSGGGAPMLRIAAGQDQYAAKIKECWGFDSMYGLVAPYWIAWAKSHPQQSLYAYYGKARGGTDKMGKKRYLPMDNAVVIACEVRKLKLTNVCVQPSAAKTTGNDCTKRKASAHFWVPQVHLKERLLNSPCQAASICPKSRL